MPLLSTMQRPPKQVANALLRQIETEAQAVAVSMVGFKLAYIAASLGKSEAYISRIKNGKRRVPEWFVEPFCWVTGTLLLQQFRDLQEALREVEKRSQQQVISRLAEQLRACA